MFSKNEIKRINSNISVNESMVNKLEEWQRMLEGSADWVKDDVVSLRIEQAICQEFANVVTSEMSLEVTDKQMNERISEIISDLAENLQDGLGLGSFIMRPVGNKVEYLGPNKFIPVKWDIDGSLLDVYLVEIRDIDLVRYYRFERHNITSGHLVITNEAYKGTKAAIGRKIALDSIEEWKTLSEETSFPKMSKMDIGYYRNPIKNRIDNSMMGVSIFEATIDQIEKADVQFGRLEWEYQSAERAIHVDDQALEGAKLPSGSKRLYRGLHNIAIGANGAEDLFEEFSPTIRDENFIRGLNEYFRRIEFNVSLAYGDLSNVELVEKTATEIKTSRQKKYNMVNAIERNLEKCLKGFVDAYAFYMAKMTIGYEVNITFKDSVLTNEETERLQDIQDINLGVMQKWEYRMKWYNEDEKTAKSRVSEEDSTSIGYGT